MMGSLPALDVRAKANYSPHVVILGAGASVAACPRGDRHQRPLPTMANMASILGLDRVIERAGLTYSPGDNFEIIFDEIASRAALNDLRIEVESRVREYFEALELPDHVTIYDLLLVTLRPKDLIATFNWDPLLLQAYERNQGLGRLPHAVFLHGNVYLGFCPEHRIKSYAKENCGACGTRLVPSPILLPIKKKEYSTHLLLSAEWRDLAATLKHAYLLTILGYAAPMADAAAREIMLKAWDVNRTRELAEIEVFDILPRRTLERRWKDFIVGRHWTAPRRFSRSLQLRYPRRSCEAWAFARLQQDPWAAKPVPRFGRLDRLHDWIRPLVQEEAALENDGRPFEPFR